MLLKDLRSHDRIKHINIINYFYREKITNKLVIFKYTLINKQIANELIKSLSRNKFKIFHYTIDLR